MTTTIGVEQRLAQIGYYQAEIMQSVHDPDSRLGVKWYPACHILYDSQDCTLYLLAMVLGFSYPYLSYGFTQPYGTKY
jgi:hypothetical protein